MMEILQMILSWVEVLLLGIAACIAYTIGRRQIDINSRLTDIEEHRNQPVIMVLQAVEPYEFFNIGQGPAIDIHLIEGLPDGRLRVSSEGDTLSGQAPGKTSKILRSGFLDATLETLAPRFDARILSAIRENMQTGTIWFGAIYLDLMGKSYFSTHFGSSHFSQKSFKYQKFS